MRETVVRVVFVSLSLFQSCTTATTEPPCFSTVAYKSLALLFRVGLEEGFDSDGRLGRARRVLAEWSSVVDGSVAALSDRVDFFSAYNSAMSQQRASH